jgi:hypothetical protein
MSVDEVVYFLKQPHGPGGSCRYVKGLWDGIKKAARMLTDSLHGWMDGPERGHVMAHAGLP